MINSLGGHLNLYEVTFRLCGIAFEVNKICDIEFDKLDGDQVRAKLKVEAKNFEEAREKAEKKFLEVIGALSFCINHGIKISPLIIINVLKALEPVIEEKGRSRLIKDAVASFTVKLIPQIKKTDAEETEKLLREISNLDPNPRELTLRALVWYRRGLLDEDAIDRFIDCWIALEAIGHHFAPWAKPTEKVRQTLMRHVTKREAKVLIDLRGKLFHSGMEDKVANKCPRLEEIMRKLIKETVEHTGLP